MNSGELFQAGRLSEAIAAAIQDVKNHPENLSHRTLLFALLCFEGDLERAKNQLDVVGNQAALTEAPVYASLIAAEETRRKVFSEGLKPKFLEDAPPRLEKHLQAILRLKGRQFAEAAALLEEAESERPETPGKLNETAFDDFADANDLTRSIFEFQQGREYYWVAFDQVAHLQVVMPDPVRPRDLFWAPCQILLKGGSTQRGFTPVLYAGSHQAPDTSLRLGHGTHFHDAGGGVFRGEGRKQFVAGEADPTILDLTDVEFN